MRKSLLVIIISLLSSCNNGLEPPIERASPILSGNIIVTGGSLLDSATGLRVAAFKLSSLDSASQFYNEILSGNAYLSDNLLISKADLDTIPFKFEIRENQINFKYIIASVEKNGDVFNQTAVGIFGENNSPFEVNLIDDDSVYIEIFVDFNNLPPQPF
ncbi:hypothetical protein OAQ99_07875 [Candidatus Kapabacteria bacterium]|nr:hypothetical protein [Candidatus Kapabacteria bacterium]